MQKKCYLIRTSNGVSLYMNKFYKFDPTFNYASVVPLNWAMHYAKKHAADGVFTIIEK